jgi:hypothetical protein
MDHSSHRAAEDKDRLDLRVAPTPIALGGHALRIDGIVPRLAARRRRRRRYQPLLHEEDRGGALRDEAHDRARGLVEQYKHKVIRLAERLVATGRVSESEFLPFIGER